MAYTDAEREEARRLVASVRDLSMDVEALVSMVVNAPPRVRRIAHRLMQQAKVPHCATWSDHDWSEPRFVAVAQVGGGRAQQYISYCRRCPRTRIEMQPLAVVTEKALLKEA